MNARRAIALPLGAVVLVAAVLALMFAAGGDDYRPSPPRDPCQQRESGKVAPDIEAIAERVVLTGTDELACELGITRERLLLGLASPADRRQLAADASIDQSGLARLLKRSLIQGVTRLDRASALPKTSALKEQIADELDVPGIAKTAIRNTPDAVVDDLLPTAGVLRRSIDEIDVQTLLRDLQSADALESQLRDAIRAGAMEEARAQLLDKLPGPLQDIL
ncbi:MAG TPA: hypothetical protein VNT22_02045 [Baekduia sp.]|nr:hypothetical protein [Baekduia sp.]